MWAMSWTAIQRNCGSLALITDQPSAYPDAESGPSAGVIPARHTNELNPTNKGGQSEGYEDSPRRLPLPWLHD
jgi:hypothetical protein